MKFGGTSVGDAESVRRACELVAERLDRSPLVVVSAASGVTNHLLEAAARAETRDERGMQTALEWIGDRERDLLDGLALPRERRQAAADALEIAMRQLADLTRGIYLLGECTPRSRDAVCATGEIVSHRLFTEALRGTGIAAVAVDPRQVMPTDDGFGQAAADAEELRRRCQAEIAPLLEEGTVPVTGGFVGATSLGITTTLGRGGSDLSATLFGAALKAGEVQIWTDVDGMMTADPRVVPGARLLPSVTFQEASELAYFGAKVLHPATLRPAVDLNIPVRILNTFRPEGEGTTIRADAEVPLPSGSGVRAVAWKKGICTLAVTSSRMLGAHGFLARLFQVFDQHRTPVDLITTSEVSVSMTVDGTERLVRLVEDLKGFCRTVRVEERMGLVCLVGHHLLEDPMMVSRILAALDGIPLRMLCLGSTDINLSLVMEERYAEQAVRSLHARFLEAAS